MSTNTVAADESIRRTVTVKASPALAFQVFTADFDSWWPRSHHIGKSPMKRAIVEGFVGGRCYSEQEDGTDCPWGSILVWEPPVRFVMAWQIDLQWQYQPDVALSSEVEVRFTAEPGGLTRVDLEHRNFERHGAGFEAMRAGVGSQGGWGSLLGLFAGRVGQVSE